MLRPHAALRRMAQASHYDDSFGSSFRAWEDAVQRYPPMRELRAPTEGISIDAFGGSVPLMQWTEPRSMDDIDQSPAGAASTLVMEQPLRPHYQLARMCDRATNPTADPKRFERCGTIGRMMLAHSSFFLERIEGALVLLVSGTANAVDITNARALRWQSEKFTQMGLDHDAIALDRYLTAYDALNSEIGAREWLLQKSGIPLTPPASWQLKKDGKVISPLGEWHPSKQRP